MTGDAAGIPLKPLSLFFFYAFAAEPVEAVATSGAAPRVGTTHADRSLLFFTDEISYYERRYHGYYQQSYEVFHACPLLIDRYKEIYFANAYSALSSLSALRMSTIRTVTNTATAMRPAIAGPMASLPPVTRVPMVYTRYPMVKPVPS